MRPTTRQLCEAPPRKHFDNPRIALRPPGRVRGVRVAAWTAWAALAFPAPALANHQATHVEGGILALWALLAGAGFVGLIAIGWKLKERGTFSRAKVVRPEDRSRWQGSSSTSGSTVKARSVARSQGVSTAGGPPPPPSKKGKKSRSKGKKRRSGRK